MTDSMIERVARAIEGADPETRHRNHFEVLARAAIEAMREPTEAMVDAGDSVDADGAEYSGYATVPAYAHIHWQAMIEAALSEEAK